MNKAFVQLYLRSAAIILAVTALGKAIPQSRTLCIEEPLLGSFQYQIQLSNQALLWIASAIEFIILLLIFFSRRRWLPCLAAAAWGAICLFVRLVFLGPAAVTSCNCLGWFQHVLPLSPQILSTILLLLAGWLAFGGFAALGSIWSTLKTRERERILVAGLVFAMCLGAFFWYLPPQTVPFY